jgi:hypothetical protein
MKGPRCKSRERYDRHQNMTEHTYGFVSEWVVRIGVSEWVARIGVSEWVARIWCFVCLYSVLYCNLVGRGLCCICRAWVVLHLCHTAQRF